MRVMIIECPSCDAWGARIEEYEEGIFHCLDCDEFFEPDVPDLPARKRRVREDDRD